MIRFPSGRIEWLQGLTVLVLFLPLVAVGVFVFSRHQHIEQNLADLEPRYARMLGIAGRQADFEVYTQKAGEQLKRQAYPSSQDVTQAGNDAQQRIRTLFAESKLDISSIQVLTAKEEGQFDRIPIELRVEGDITGLQNALALLAVQSPTVLTEEFTLQTIGAVKPASVQRLSGLFNFSVLRVRS